MEFIVLVDGSDILGRGLKNVVEICLPIWTLDRDRYRNIAIARVNEKQEKRKGERQRGGMIGKER